MEDRGFPTYDHVQWISCHRVKWVETNKEKFMISCIRLLLSAGTTIVALTAVVVALHANMACGLTLHRVVRAIGVQEDTDFCATPGVRVVN
jgi:hypothetical protein